MVSVADCIYGGGGNAKADCDHPKRVSKVCDRICLVVELDGVRVERKREEAVDDDEQAQRVGQQGNLFVNGPNKEWKM